MRIVRNIKREHGKLERDVEDFWGTIIQSGSGDERDLFLRIANEVARLERVQFDMEFGTPVSRLELIRIGYSPALRRLAVPDAIKMLCAESISLIDLHQTLTAIAPACWEIILTEYWGRYADNSSPARLSLMGFGDAILDLAEDVEGLAPRMLRTRLAEAIRPLVRLPRAVCELVEEHVTDAQRRRIARILKPTVEMLLSETGHIRQTTPPPPPSGMDGDPSSSDGDGGPTSIRLLRSLDGSSVGSAVG